MASLEEKWRKYREPMYRVGSNDKLFSIKAKDNSRRGYWPGKDEKDACERFGINIEECSIKRVEWNGKEFIEVNQSKQERLL